MPVSTPEKPTCAPGVITCPALKTIYLVRKKTTKASESTYRRLAQTLHPSSRYLCKRYRCSRIMFEKKTSLKEMRQLYTRVMYIPSYLSCFQHLLCFVCSMTESVDLYQQRQSFLFCRRVFSLRHKEYVEGSKMASLGTDRGKKIQTNIKA